MKNDAAGTTVTVPYGRWIVIFDDTNGARLITPPAASITGTGLIELATSSEVQAAADTSRAVSPATQKYHPGTAKVWARFSATTSTITSSSGVSSVSSGGVVNFTSAFSSSDEVCPVATTGPYSGDDTGFAFINGIGASSVDFDFGRDGGVAGSSSMPLVCAVVFGTL